MPQMFTRLLHSRLQSNGHNLRASRSNFMRLPDYKSSAGEASCSIISSLFSTPPHYHDFYHPLPHTQSTTRIRSQSHHGKRRCHRPAFHRCLQPRQRPVPCRPASRMRSSRFCAAQGTRNPTLPPNSDADPPRHHRGRLGGGETIPCCRRGNVGALCAAVIQRGPTRRTTGPSQSCASCSMTWTLRSWVMRHQSTASPTAWEMAARSPIPIWEMPRRSVPMATL
jgi:hypothetical protein